MSGSSRASVVLTRCVITLDTGMNIEWAPDENGSIEHGMAVHLEEEEAFVRRIERGAPTVEVLFDELEESGRRFTAPTEGDFYERCQRGDQDGGLLSGDICSVQLACEPPLSSDELAQLVARISKLVAV